MKEIELRKGLGMDFGMTKKDAKKEGSRFKQIDGWA
jgi:hypothetical protein